MSLITDNGHGVCYIFIRIFIYNGLVGKYQ